MMRWSVAGWMLVTIGLIPATVGAGVAVSVHITPPPPVVLAAPPPVVVLPGIPLVRYAPSVPFDLFVFQHRWYYASAGSWYVGPSYRGPWTVVPVGRLPASIVAVPVRYYKVPPGHLRKGQGHGPPGHGRGRGRGH